MGFYSKEPVDKNKTTVEYLWTGFETPGIFLVHVEGEAPNYSTGFTLSRDTDFVGGLKINVMGWNGSIGKGSTHYSVNGSFNGECLPRIVISGSNGNGTYLSKIKC